MTNAGEKMKIEKKIHKSVLELINIWTADIDGDIPIQFADNLAAGMFASDIGRLCKRFYIIGKKEQKRKHKQRAVKRFFKGMPEEVRVTCWYRYDEKTQEFIDSNIVEEGWLYDKSRPDCDKRGEILWAKGYGFEKRSVIKRHRGSV